MLKILRNVFAIIHHAPPFSGRLALIVVVLIPLVVLFAWVALVEPFPLVEALSLDRTWIVEVGGWLFLLLLGRLFLRRLQCLLRSTLLPRRPGLGSDGDDFRLDIGAGPVLTFSLSFNPC